MPKKPADDNSTKRLLIDPSGQTEMFEKSYQQELAEQKSKPVECLGRTFPNDAARREHYLARLKEYLQDPEFRKTPGFPNGTDEDILRLSDPPYYTACPNPFVGAFIETHRHSADVQLPEPFAADVSHGKGDLIYSAHSYHTKVPADAIVEYILHYTQPGDVVLDPFSGSGMTGLAALMCSQPALCAVSKSGKSYSWGARTPILVDLSPAAAFIANTYLSPPNATGFSETATHILNEVQRDTADDWQVDGKPVEYFVKTEVFGCPDCQSDIITDAVVKMTDTIGAAVAFKCPHCGAMVSKAPSAESDSSRLTRRLFSEYDQALKVAVPTQRLATIAAMLLHSKTGTLSVLSESQRAAVDRHVATVSDWFPLQALIDGERSVIRDCCKSYGITHVHRMYSSRQLRYISRMWALSETEQDYEVRTAMLFWIQSYHLGATRLNRFIPAKQGKSGPGSQVNRYFTGTLYIPSMVSEVSPDYLYRRKIKRLSTAFAQMRGFRTLPRLITTQSATSLAGIPSASIDYVFTDPPFGKNLQYSELNQIWEAWLRIMTNRDPEAVIDETRGRLVAEYQELMRMSFAEIARVLKPGRWMTLEFHNSFNSVWVAIQEAISSVGLVVADVRVLDKQQDTYKQSRQGLVKKDLIISAYKPAADVAQRFEVCGGTHEGVWEFVRGHLSKLPVCVMHAGVIESVPERQHHLLFDRMVAFHVQRGISVPMSASELAEGLNQRFAERDDMYFLADQVAEYDRKRLLASEVGQQDLFVVDEATAIQWLRRELRVKPSTLAELHPRFMKEIAGWQKHERSLELLRLLEENFIKYDGKDEVPSQIHAYLSSNYKELRNKSKSDGVLQARAKERWYVPDPKRAGDLEKLRERGLLKEFDEYRQSKSKKIDVFRVEAMRAGFKAAYDRRDYNTIVDVAEKLPEAVLQEDEKLLMYYDVAVMRAGDRKAKTELF